MNITIRILSYICLILTIYQRLMIVSSQSNKTNALTITSADENTLLLPEPSSEQDKVDTILRAFRNLPPEELQHIDISIDIESAGSIKAGTDAAKQLIEAWTTRQIEFKKAVESMIAPAEQLKQLCTILNNQSASEIELVNTIQDLEYLLSDVDNARDFHTIGCWPALTQHLLIKQSDDTIHNDSMLSYKRRTYTAWAIGTAVKNDYDYQLWVLESIHTIANNTNSTTNILVPHDQTVIYALISILYDESLSLHSGGAATGIANTITTANPTTTTANLSTTADLIKKAIYAISAAARGNADVQAIISNIILPNNTTFIQTISSILQRNETKGHNSDLEIQRKLWSLSADMLQERRYIRQELLLSLTNTDTLHPTLSTTAQSEIDALQLLGDQYCVPLYAQTTIQALHRLTSGPVYTPLLHTLLHPHSSSPLPPPPPAPAADSTPSEVTSYLSMTITLPIYRATLEHVLIVLRELAIQCPHTLLSTTTTTPTTTATNIGATVNNSNSKKGDTMLLYIQSLLRPIATTFFSTTTSTDPSNIHSSDSTVLPVLQKGQEVQQDEEEGDVYVDSMTPPKQALVEMAVEINRFLMEYRDSIMHECSIQGSCE